LTAFGEAPGIVAQIFNLRIADLQSAPAGKHLRPPCFPRLVEYNSAIRQVANLRYTASLPGTFSCSVDSIVMDEAGNAVLKSPDVLRIVWLR